MQVSPSATARYFVVGLGLALCAVGATPTRANGQDLVGTVRAAGQLAKNVVVWLDVPRAARSEPPPTIVMDQRNLRFVPHVLAVPVGTVVEMPNSDRVFHNVFSFHDGKVFDLGLYPVGTSKTVTFDKPGLSRIFCNIHPDMGAYVVAVDSDVYAVSDGRGRFVMASVGEGSYTYHAWRPGADTVTGTLVVAPGRPVEIALP
jgi:plastocyanin